MSRVQVAAQTHKAKTPPEVKAQALERVKEGWAVWRIAAEADVDESTVRVWARAAGLSTMVVEVKKPKTKGSGQIAGPCYARGLLWPSRYQRGM